MPDLLTPSSPVRKRFQFSAALTVTIIFALILVGGIVRATGAGMGCPDWPTCFGQWIPPTSESQLPANYQQIYADRGYADTTFNVRKTWTEYLNRLLGVVTGLAILMTLVFAIPFRRIDGRVLTLSLSGFILVVFQGWLGSRVVASNLMPGMITVHMLVAQLIVGIMIAALMRASMDDIRKTPLGPLPASFYPLLIVAMIAGLFQLVLGTQVREAVDLISRSEQVIGRHLWIDNLSWVFTVHKYYAIPLIALNAWLVFSVLSLAQSVWLKRLAVALTVFMLGTTAVGMGMYRLNMPMYAQPLHLWLASLIFGTQLAMLILVQYARSAETEGAGTQALQGGTVLP